MKMKTMNSVGLIAAGALLLAAKANAGSYSVTVDYGSPTPLGPGNTTQNLLVGPFNNLLGTLTGVTIGLDSVNTGDVSIYNSTGLTQAFSNATATEPVTVTGPDSLSATATGNASIASGTVAPGLNNFPGLPASASSSVSVPNADLPAFEGVSDITLSVYANGGTYGGSSVSGVFFGGSFTSTGDVVVTYDYTAPAVPDGGLTAGLLGSALVGLGALRRKFVA
jgi:hypothetical protein